MRLIISPITDPGLRTALDEFGADYIELTSPAASEQSRLDCEAICKLGLKVRFVLQLRNIGFVLR
jgi:isopropylmalate/homocitrate/citramalate synthase